MLASAFILGLLGSLHCVGMCGPIAFMLPVDHSSALKKIIQISIYHLGRLLAYGIIGLLFGFIGKGLYLFGYQQQLSIGIGIAMILFIIVPKKIKNNYTVSGPIYRLISKIKSALGKSIKSKTSDTFLTIGFLNGFLPCGLVYMAVFAAMAPGNSLSGGLYMVLFGLGTIPLMTTVIYFTQFLKGSARQHIQKLIPVFVVIIGLLFVMRGLGLGIPYLSPAPSSEVMTHTINCH
ncbi:sulfite exporter TauE/SafE family protein [Aestuariivivens sediminis]|uniref:sulfite exporter TauE/SafE family protein n=1 Tax=Aestuariivivens sediminis TaxID=2913557 RepID=UPI001F560E93|nr:sulfite exporter TauE/SafE family protein [Aestuariivivens sediminis]